MSAGGFPKYMHEHYGEKLARFAGKPRVRKETVDRIERYIDNVLNPPRKDLAKYSEKRAKEEIEKYNKFKTECYPQ